MSKKIDRSVHIARAIRQALTLIQIEGWDHDSAKLGELAAVTQHCLNVAEQYAAQQSVPAGTETLPRP